ncbi:MAG: phosphatidylserine/phosphatidylglycerophosphate/cardiolipin synthase family protein [Opitutaceae bacterium]
MLSVTTQTACQWLRTGDEVFPAMLAAIDSARSYVCLEMYLFAPGPLGERFREALVRAQRRGAQVRVLIDAFGSMGLPDHFWEPLRSAGGEVRWFNPAALMRFSFRNHRKLLVCDRQAAFVGGFNIAHEYEGDGVHSGWHDLGLRLEGPLAAQLGASFEEMFARADFRHKRFIRLRRFTVNRSDVWPPEQVFFSEPGRRRNPIKLALRGDLAQARDVRIMVAYFLPTRRLRRDLRRIARRGGRVQLILPGKSDVPLSQLAGQSLYRRFLKDGVDIYEYHPQILHAKLIVADDVVYFGSSNLDPRSLRVNYEMMIRFQNPEMAEKARGIFDGDLKQCRRIELEEWRKSRTLWRHLKERAAYWLLVWIDPNLARRQWRALPD